MVVRPTTFSSSSSSMEIFPTDEADVWHKPRNFDDLEKDARRLGMDVTKMKRAQNDDDDVKYDDEDDGSKNDDEDVGADERDGEDAAKQNRYDGDDGNDGTLELNGANIPVSAGTYNITLNLAANPPTISIHQW